METTYDARPSSSRLMIVALAAPVAASALLSAFRDSVPNTQAALALVLVVVAVASAGHRLSGVVAALSSALWFDFFLTIPYHRFAISDRDDIETAVLLTLVGLAVSEIALWGRRQQARASRGAGYLDGVVSAARMAAAGQPAPSVVAFVSTQIMDVLGVERCEFREGHPGSRPRLNADGSVTRDGRPLDVDRHGLPTDDEIELPVEHHGRVVGRFVLVSATRVTYPSLDQRLVAVTLAEQVGVALAGAPSSRPSER